jgi:hypothetical protein
MKKPFRFLLVALFLGMQMFSLLHMAHHGFAKHEHQGQICSAWYFSEQSKSADVPVLAVAPAPVFAKIGPKTFLPAFLIRSAFEGARSRAPPAFLLG